MYIIMYAAVPLQASEGAPLSIISREGHMKREQDLRFIRTAQRIKAAFFQLADSIGFEKMTVRDLAERAGINRSTFYLHYTDKFDLLDKLEDELLREIKTSIATMPLQDFGEVPLDFSKATEVLTLVYTHIQENHHLFSLILVQNGGASFQRKFVEAIQSMLQAQINLPALLGVPEHYLLALIAGLHTGLIREWLRSGMRESPAEMADIILKMARGIMQGFVQNPAIPTQRKG